MSKARGPYRVDPLGYKKANEALDKMADNARELGLDYEPMQDGGIVTAGGSDPRTQRTWVGLTDEERDAMIGVTDLSGTYYYDDLYAVILAAEGKLAEKNA